MSALSDEYIKNFSKERKAVFNKRFRDDYDPNMSERSNIIRILGEMRELGLADGGRIGLKEGLGSFTTNDPTEAFKEVINRIINKNVKGATLPISDNISLNLGPEINDVELGGIIEVLGGEFGFGGGLKGDDKGIGFSFKKEFNKGGRVAYQDGTPERQPYETPVTDVIKSVNEKTIDALEKGGELFNEYTGINEVYDFPGVGSSATGAPSDFRHQAASNALAKALGKGKFKDPILGPISYLSGGIGSFGLGTGKEIIDFFQGVADPDMTTKEAFDQALEDTISNFKGAFAIDKTSEDLYAELMKDYVPRGLRMIDDPLFNSRQIFAQRKKAIENARKKQKDTIVPPSKPKRTTTTKPGTGGGGLTESERKAFAPRQDTFTKGKTVTLSSGRKYSSPKKDGGLMYAYGGRAGLENGGLARMLGE